MRARIEELEDQQDEFNQTANQLDEENKCLKCQNQDLKRDISSRDELIRNKDSNERALQRELEEQSNAKSRLEEELKAAKLKVAELVMQPNSDVSSKSAQRKAK